MRISIMKRSKISSTQNLYIDIGSGYNPKSGYKTADITGFPNLDYLIKDNKLYSKKAELKENTVDKFRLRNVIHHVKDLNQLFINLFRYLKPNGIIEIIDCNKKHYSANLCLDNLWYRYVIPRKEIFIANAYRDYANLAKTIGFNILNKNVNKEKEITILQK